MAKTTEKGRGFLSLGRIWNLLNEVEHDADVLVDAVVDSRKVQYGTIRVVRSGGRHYAQKGNGISQLVEEEGAINKP